MSSSALIDIPSLLVPIEGELTVGSDLREDPSYTSDYQQLKDARRAARDAERNNMFDGDSTEAQEHWNIIFQLAPKVIANQAKDLEVACWLTEALVRKAGFLGLQDGFSLIRQLVETFWEEGLYPVEDEDGIETRVAPISGLNGEGADGILLSPIRNSLITDDSVGEDAYSLWQYQQALDASRLPDESQRESANERNEFSVKSIEKAVGECSDEFYQELFNAVNVCLTEYRAVDSLLIEFCGVSDSPSTSKIIELLENADEVIKHLAKAKLSSINDNQESNVEDETEERNHQSQGTSSSQQSTVTTALNSRADAFKQLTIIADFFKTTEPHSPISFLLSKSVRWGEMSLEELMGELIPDSSSRELYSSLTGVNIKEEEDDY